jgi:hypothetical protein
MRRVTTFNLAIVLTCSHCLFHCSMWDVRSRVLNLSSLGLFPKLFGQDVTKVFKQKYYGEDEEAYYYAHVIHHSVCKIPYNVL